MSQPIFKLLEKTLDYTTVKQRLISKNIANISTKNYQREDIKFDDFLNGNGQLKTTERRHIKTGEVSLKGQAGFKIIKEGIENDGNEDEANTSGNNNVDMDTEMADMAQNSILFRLAARRMNFYFNQIQTVIKGGR